MIDRTFWDNPQLVIPSTFEDCLTYELQILYLKKYIDDIATGGQSPELSDIYRRLSEIDSQYEQLKAELDQVQADVSALQIDKITEELNTINAELSKLSQTQTAQAQTLANLTETVGNHTQDLADIDKSIEEIQTATQANEKAISGLQDETHTNSQNIQQIQQNIQTINGNVESIQNNLDTKQDKLTFDTTPTKNSANPVTSGGIEAAIVAVDSKVSENSENIQNLQQTVATLSEDMETAQGDIAALETDKQNTLTFDTTPTAGSQNPVTSEGIKQAIDNATPPAVTLADEVTETGTTAVKSSGIFGFVKNETSPISENVTKNTEAITAAKSDISKNTANIGALTETVAGKQNKLTFDETPTDGSTNPVTSGGIAAAISAVDSKVSGNSENIQNLQQTVANKQNKLTFDSTPTKNSTNPVTSEGIEVSISAVDSKVSENSENIQNLQQEMQNKQNTLTFDTTPTAGSQNPVTSEGIKQAIDNATPPAVTLADEVTETGTTAVKSSGIFGFVKNETSPISENVTKNTTNIGTLTETVAGKQDKLTFDETPTDGSTNPVTSGGIREALDSIRPPTLVLEDTVTEQSSNAVKSFGIYNFVKNENLPLSEAVQNLQQEIQNKQDKLTFDETPTDGSTNPVTSGGVYKSISGVTSDFDIYKKWMRSFCFYIDTSLSIDLGTGIDFVGIVFDNTSVNPLRGTNNSTESGYDDKKIITFRLDTQFFVFPKAENSQLKNVVPLLINGLEIGSGSSVTSVRFLQPQILNCRLRVVNLNTSTKKVELDLTPLPSQLGITLYPIQSGNAKNGLIFTQPSTKTFRITVKYWE